MFFKEMVLLNDMWLAYIDCKKRKNSKPGAIEFEYNALYNVQSITNEINERSYELRPSKCFIITQPTYREIFCADFRDRVVQHFVYRELNPIIDKMLIYDAANCRKGKGTDFAAKRVIRFVRQASDNYKNADDTWYLKMDLSGFFMRIVREKLLEQVLDIIENRYEGSYQEELKYLVRIIILADATKNCIRVSNEEMWKELPLQKTLFDNPNGLPIGNICSQMCANLYLNNLDHFIKSRHKFYSRYVDDMIIIDKDKNKLYETLEMIREYLPEINMTLNQKKTFINKVKNGFTYVGVRIFPYYARVSKRRIKQLHKSQKTFKSKQDALQKTISRKGMFQHYKGYNDMAKWMETLNGPFKDCFVFTKKFEIYLREEEKT